MVMKLTIRGMNLLHISTKYTDLQIVTDKQKIIFIFMIFAIFAKSTDSAFSDYFFHTKVYIYIQGQGGGVNDTK